MNDDWTGWLQALTGGRGQSPEPAWPETPEAGRARPLIVGPGGVTGNEAPRAEPPDPVRLSAELDMHRRWGREAGALARQSGRGPRVPRLPDEPETPAIALPIGPGGVTGADPYRVAAYSVGVPERFVRALAEHESGTRDHPQGDPNAQASTSSALGLGQFINKTWRTAMTAHGARYGLGEGALADLSDDDLLALRTNPQWALLMAAEHSRDNAIDLRARISRTPTEGEVYLAHFLGTDTATRLIQAADQDRRRDGRSRRAVDIVGREAAEANRNVFYNGARPRSAAEVIELQTRKFGRGLFDIGDRVLPD